MGSSGSGSFSDYSGRSGQPKKEKSEGEPTNPAGSSSGSGSSGGSSGTDLCRQAFSASLEDVALYDLYTKTGSVPQPNDQLTLALSTRIIARDANGVAVGALPTSLNYLADCLSSGFNYQGIVRSSSLTPVPQVDVDFVAI